MNVLIFCKIHFTRTVYKLIPETGNATETAEARNRLLSLTECQTREDYQLLTDLIKGKRLFCQDFTSYLQVFIEDKPELAGWVRHKQIDVIAAGLCEACSPMKREFFEEARRNTNAVEQSHYKSYFMGTQDSLLQAVIKYV